MKILIAVLVEDGVKVTLANLDTFQVDQSFQKPLK